MACNELHISNMVYGALFQLKIRSPHKSNEPREKFYAFMRKCNSSFRTIRLNDKTLIWKQFAQSRSVYSLVTYRYLYLFTGGDKLVFALQACQRS